MYWTCNLELGGVSMSRPYQLRAGADPTVRRVGLNFAEPTPPGCDRTT
jgi:hypothetical protein